MFNGIFFSCNASSSSINTCQFVSGCVKFLISKERDQPLLSSLSYALLSTNKYFTQWKLADNLQQRLLMWNIFGFSPSYLQIRPLSLVCHWTWKYDLLEGIWRKSVNLLITKLARVNSSSSPYNGSLRGSSCICFRLFCTNYASPSCLIGRNGYLPLLEFSPLCVFKVSELWASLCFESVSGNQQSTALRACFAMECSQLSLWGCVFV